MSLGDTLDREPKDISDPNPKELTLRRAVRRHNSQSADRKKKANTTMFMKTSSFRFAEINNYLVPGTYDR